MNDEKVEKNITKYMTYIFEMLALFTRIMHCSATDSYFNSDSFSGSELDLNWASKPVTLDTVDGRIRVSSFTYEGTEAEKVIVHMGSEAGIKTI